MNTSEDPKEKPEIEVFSGDDEFGDEVFHQTLNIWINPEIERRKTAGLIPEDFVLQGAQVIFGNHSGITPEVRLNSEVRAVARGRATRDIDALEAVSAGDFQGTPEILLTDDDPNAAHITMVRWGQQWVIAFDFRYNTQRVLEHLRVAQQFLRSSEAALKIGDLEAFVDTLFSAVELLAKASLLMFDEEALNARRHNFTHDRYNRWAKAGNARPEFAVLLNRLGALRPAGRYVSKPLSLSAEEASQLHKTAIEMYEDTAARVPERVSVPDEIRHLSTRSDAEE